MFESIIRKDTIHILNVNKYASKVIRVTLYFDNYTEDRPLCIVANWVAEGNVYDMINSLNTERLYVRLCNILTTKLFGFNVRWVIHIFIRKEVYKDIDKAESRSLVAEHVMKIPNKWTITNVNNLFLDIFAIKKY